MGKYGHLKVLENVPYDSWLCSVYKSPPLCIVPSEKREDRHCNWFRWWNFCSEAPPRFGRSVEVNFLFAVQRRGEKICWLVIRTSRWSLLQTERMIKKKSTSVYIKNSEYSSVISVNYNEARFPSSPKQHLRATHVHPDSQSEALFLRYFMSSWLREEMQMSVKHEST